MKQFFLLWVAIVLVLACWFALDKWVAYNAEAVTATASVELTDQNSYATCVQECKNKCQ